MNEGDSVTVYDLMTLERTSTPTEPGPDRFRQDGGSPMRFTTKATRDYGILSFIAGWKDGALAVVVPTGVGVMVVKGDKVLMNLEMPVHLQE